MRTLAAMSPLALRRYRADRLLREEFQALRGRVLKVVEGRLRARGMELDGADLEACYATAWQGLHASMLDGQEIDNPVGWLVLVTFRRAVEDCRVRGPRVSELVGSPAGARALDACSALRADDLADGLDDRIRIAHLFEGLRARLDPREREAAMLCYLQGLSRAEAAARMGISAARMRKLMEGRGAGDPGVRGKLGVLAATIESGGWCDSQGSLMRAFAYGVLAPDGERYRLAAMHCESCPACRNYVLSLRGLAGVLPPVLLPWGPLAAAFGGARAATHLTAAARHGQSGAVTSNGLGGYASGTAGASGAAGSGFLLTGGGFGAKLAVGCLIALGVGGGCVALDAGTQRAGHRAPARHVRAARGRASIVSAARQDIGRIALAEQSQAALRAEPDATAYAARAAREFGPEQDGSVAAGPPRSSTTAKGESALARVARQASSAPTVSTAAPVPSPSPSRAAEREFAPG
jgi:DNA-directed RNA polymerase specialized sigma24 family protein